MPSRAAAGPDRVISALLVAATVLSPLQAIPAHSTRTEASAGHELVSREVFLMGTRAVLSTSSGSRPEGLQRLERLLRPLEDTEAQLSTWQPDSEVSRLNASAGGDAGALSRSLCEVMTTLDRLTLETERAFDPAIGAVAAAWDLHGRGRVPDARALQIALDRSGWHRLSFDASACTLRMPMGMALNVGAFGKGEALDRARRAAGADWPWMIDLGGQVAVAGAPPAESAWNVSIAEPHRRDRPSIRLRLSAGSIATSGGSERDLRVGRQRIGHILDPRTGWPVAFDGSATVWHEQALVADVLSTALFVMGPEEGLRWADARGIAVVYLTRRSGDAIDVRASQAFTNRFGPLTS